MLSEVSYAIFYCTMCWLITRDAQCDIFFIMHSCTVTLRLVNSYLFLWSFCAGISNCIKYVKKNQAKQTRMIRVLTNAVKTATVSPIKWPQNHHRFRMWHHLEAIPLTSWNQYYAYVSEINGTNAVLGYQISTATD